MTANGENFALTNYVNDDIIGAIYKFDNKGRYIDVDYQFEEHAVWGDLLKLGYTNLMIPVSPEKRLLDAIFPSEESVMRRVAISEYERWVLARNARITKKIKIHTRLARIRALPHDLSGEQLLTINRNFNNTCAMTGEASPIHLDHVIPIAVGHGGTTYGNMIPLRADLNISKSANHIFEWFEANRERFGLSQAKFDALIVYLAEVNGVTPQEYRTYVDWCFDNPRTLDKLTEGEESA